MSLGVTYPFLATPFTTITGRMVNDPGSEQATFADCLPYTCGANPEEMLPRQWCAWWGRSGARACVDPACQPWRNQIPGCAPLPPLIPPQPVPVTMPVLTPQNIVQPLPDITSIAPMPLAENDCSLWCVLNGAITAHPVIAVAILVGVAFIVWPKGAGR